MEFARHHRLTALAAFVLVAGILVLVPSLALAQGGQPPADPQAGFVPVKDLPAQEALPAAPLLIAAYAFVWVALLAYVWSVWRRLAGVEREVRHLSARLTERQGRA